MLPVGPLYLGPAVIFCRFHSVVFLKIPPLGGLPPLIGAAAGGKPRLGGQAEGGAGIWEIGFDFCRPGAYNSREEKRKPENGRSSGRISLKENRGQVRARQGSPGEWTREGVPEQGRPLVWPTWSRVKGESRAGVSVPSQVGWYRRLCCPVPYVGRDFSFSNQIKKERTVWNTNFPTGCGA